MSFNLADAIASNTLSDKTLSRVCTRSDVSKVLYSCYENDYLISPCIHAAQLNVAELRQLFQYCLTQASQSTESRPLDFKIINTLLKISEKGMPYRDYRKAVVSLLEKKLWYRSQNPPKPHHELTDTGNLGFTKSGVSGLRNFIFIYYESYTANAYLTSLIAQNIFPSLIIDATPQRSKKSKFKSHIRKSFHKLFKTGPNSNFPLPSEIASRLHSYGGKLSKIETVTLEGGLNTLQLAELISSRKEDAVIFTGGGILKKDFLAAAGKKFIHIHPGHLPHVRGADGLFWSVLLQGHSSYTGFIMEAGIDTGKILVKKHFSHTPIYHIQPRLLRFAKGYPFYTSLLDTIDPWLRAYTLCEFLSMDGLEWDSLPALPQDQGEGDTYHFMHHILREKVLQLLF